MASEPDPSEAAWLEQQLVAADFEVWVRPWDEIHLSTGMIRVYEILVPEDAEEDAVEALEQARAEREREQNADHSGLAERSFQTWRTDVVVEPALGGRWIGDVDRSGGLDAAGCRRRFIAISVLILLGIVGLAIATRIATGHL